MLLKLFITGLLAWLPSLPRQAASSSPQRAFIDSYCVGCHTQKNKERGTVPIALDNADISNPGRGCRSVGKGHSKNARRSDAAARRRPAGRGCSAQSRRWLEESLDRVAAANPNPGRPLIHRLNRAEYANAIRDLLALQIDAAALLPPDDSAYGFDNMADALGFSPLLQERYVAAAMKIGALAVGDPHLSPSGETYVHPSGSFAGPAYRRPAAWNGRRNACPP